MTNATAARAAATPRTRPDVAEELVTFVSPSSFEADQYRVLRHYLETVQPKSGARVVAITSAGPGEGKTVTTLNLAGAIARSSQTRVLVIDADLRQPAVAQYMHVPDGGLPGLAEALARDDCQLGTLTRRLDALNISVLLAGRAEDSTYDLLGSNRIQEFLAEARATYDYVLIDTPPLLPLPDARVVEQWADALVLVVAAHKTPRPAVAEALALIDPAKLIAVAFNGDDRPLSAYYRFYGYGRAAPPARR
jgi:capsular exopolysaccharide synthesis family protein